MRTTVAERIGIALLVVAAGMALGASSGINMNQVRTAAPGAVSVSGVAAAEGSSLAASRADHTHSLTGTLPVANGGTGNTSGNAATATALSTAGTTTQFWRGDNAWGTPVPTFSAMTPGGVGYWSSSTVIGSSAAGSSGALLTSGGTGAPTWTAAGTSGKILFGNTGATPQWSTLGLTSSAIATNQGTVNQVLHGNAAGLPSWGGVAVGDISATGTPTSSTYLAGDGTWSSPSVGFSGMNQGGVVYASSTTAVASSSAGSSGALLASGGTGSPTWTAAGTSGQVLFGNTGAAPTWGAMSLTSSSVAANQGTTVQVLHGNAAGLPSWGQVAVADLGATGTPSATTYLRGDGTWSTPAGGGGSPGGSSGQLQYNSGGTFAGSARATIDAAGNIVLPGGAEPAVPASGVTLFSEDRGDVSLLASIGVQGYDRYAQPHLGMENVAMMFPAGGATGTTAPSVIGMTVTHEGTTIANPAPASTNFYSATTRITSTSGTTVGNAAGWRAGQLRYWRGNAANLGGYHCHFRWCNDTATASNRGFVGLSASVAARANQNPSADLNVVGAFWDSTSTSILLGGNDGTGTATATTTCSSTDFPPRTANHCFSLDLAAKKNATQVTAYLKRLDTSGITPCAATISVAGDQPANTAFLAPRITYQTSTTSATGVGVLKMYCEQDN